MLTQAFNETVDYQGEMQAILREKTLENDLEAHNHTLKGHDFVIPRNGAINIADGGKLAYTNDKKFNDIYKHILRMQALMAEIEAGFERLDDILDQIEEETASLEKITELLNEGDWGAAREYITSVTGEDASQMTDEEAREWLIHQGYEHIDSIEKLTEQWTAEYENLQDKINQLPEGSQERLAAEKRLEGLEGKYREIAKYKGLEEKFKSYALREVNAKYELSKEAMAEASMHRNKHHNENREEFKSNIARSDEINKLEESLDSSKKSPLSNAKLRNLLKPAFDKASTNTVATTLEDKKEPLADENNNVTKNQSVEEMDKGLSAMSTNIKLG